MTVLKNLLTICTLLLLFACGTKNKSQEEIQKDWKTFETQDYSIKYPRLWMVNQSGYMGTSFLIISKQTSIRDFYQENVSLVEEVVSDTTDLEQYVQISIKELQDTVQYVEIIKDTLISHNENNFHQLIYESQEGMNKITTEKYFFLKKQKAYTLTFSAKSIELGRYQPIGEGILNSFKLK